MTVGGEGWWKPEIFEAGRSRARVHYRQSKDHSTAAVSRPSALMSTSLEIMSGDRLRQVHLVPSHAASS